MRIEIVRTVLALLLVGPLVAGDVLTVAADGTADHPDVISAVAAAQDGDIILVDAGCYDAPILIDRDLTLVAREDDGAGLCGLLQVRDQSAGKTVLISGRL
jgi:hypothetical protein